MKTVVPSSALLLTMALSPSLARGQEVDESTTLEQRIAQLTRAGGLTADQAAQQAVATNPDILARRAEVDAAQAAVGQSEVAFAPKLNLTGSYARLSDFEAPLMGYAVAAPPGTPVGLVQPGTPFVNVPQKFPVLVNATTAQAMLTLPISDYLLRLSQSYTGAKRSKRAAELQEIAQQLRVQADAKIAYYTWARATLSILVAEQNLAQAQTHLRDVTSSFDGGIASKADVLRVESQVASAQGILQKARHFLAVAEEQLRTTMHGPRASLVLGEDLSTALPALAPALTPELYEEAVAHRPELQALENTELALRKQASSTRAGLWPRLNGFGEVTVANPNQRYIPPQDRFNTTWSVGVALSWSPNESVSTYAQAKGADAKVRQVVAQRSALADGIRMELASAVQAVLDADTSVATSTQGLASSEASYRVRRSLFQVGRATSGELTDAETDLLRAKLDAVNARVDQRISRIRFAHALGRDNEAPVAKVE
jgi:outer membrane protein TolC